MYNKEARRQKYLENQKEYREEANIYYAQNKDIVLKKYHLNKKSSLYYRIQNADKMSKNHFFYKYLPILEKYQSNKHYCVTLFSLDYNEISIKFNSKLFYIYRSKIVLNDFLKNKANRETIFETNSESIEKICQMFCKK